MIYLKKKLFSNLVFEFFEFSRYIFCIYFGNWKSIYVREVSKLASHDKS